MRDAGAEHTFAATSPPSAERLRRRPGTDPTPQSRHVMGTARMGHDPSTSVCDPVAAAVGRRQRRRHRFVRVPHLDGLRADAHDRGARHPGRARARRTRAAPLRTPTRGMRRRRAVVVALVAAAALSRPGRRFALRVEAVLIDHLIHRPMVRRLARNAATLYTARDVGETVVPHRLPGAPARRR